MLAPGPLFAHPWEPFTVLGLHFWRPHGTYLVVSEVSLTSISFSHALHSNKEPISFQYDNSKSCTSPSESVLQICYKKCPAAHAARSAALTFSLYITGLASLRGTRNSGSPMSVTSPFWPLGSPFGAQVKLLSAPRTSFLCFR